MRSIRAMRAQGRTTGRPVPHDQRRHGSDGLDPLPRPGQARARLVVAALEVVGVIAYVAFLLSADAPEPCSGLFWWSAIAPPTWFLLLIVAGLALGPSSGSARRRIAALGTAVAAMAFLGTGLIFLLSLVGTVGADSC